MKITKIERQKEIFTITKSPNLIQRFFGVKTKVEKYKDIGETYHYSNNVSVYVNQIGQAIGASHKVTKAIENWKRRF